MTPSPDGLFYGSTRLGGANDGGTLFRIGQDGDGFTLLHTFPSADDDGSDSLKFVVLHDFSPPNAAYHNADGAYPRAGLIQGRDGALYGVTAGGGPDGAGTVFRLVPPAVR